jgi:hypothetical protein
LAICIATLAIHAPLSAHQKVQSAERSAAAVQIRDRNTNQAMLDALLARRADVARSAGNAESRHSALKFLDRQIAGVRSRLAE